MLKDIYGFDVTNQDIALIGQYSENNYNGCNCGIMDQFASAMGKRTMQFSLTAILLILSMHQSFWTVQRSWLQTAWLSTAL